MESHFPSHSEFVTQAVHLLASSEATEAEANVPADWQVGDTILGLYRVEKVLGEGGMGRVYQVRHRGWGIDLAVKSPRPGLVGKPAAVERFEKECETWINLGLHPYVVSCYYVRRLGGIPRIFAEYVEGTDGFSWIRDKALYAGGPERALERILTVAIHSAWGLQHAHNMGVIHRDVKSHNILIRTEGIAKVTDFGLAEAVIPGEGSAPARKGGMTPAFSSPEQYESRQVDHRSDMWSWALCMLHMFAGRILWKVGPEGGQALDKYLAEGPPAADMPAMPAEFAALMRQCFQDDPKQRPADMMACTAILAGIYESVTGTEFPYEPPKAIDAVAHSMNNKAVSLMDLGKTEQAIKLWEESIRMEAGLAQARYNLGLVLWRLGRISDETLLQKLKEVNALHADRVLPLKQLVHIHLERGDCIAAQSLLEEGIRTQGERQDLVMALERAKALVPRSRRIVRRIEAHADAVRALYIYADGHFAVSASEDNTIKFWQLPEGQLLREYTGHTGSIEALSASPDGRYLLSIGQDRMMKLWERATGKCVFNIEVSRETVRTACLTGDGQHALTRGPNNTIAVWDLQRGMIIQELEGHRDWVNAIAVSEAGRYAVSGSQDMTAIVWDLNTLEPMRALEGHEAAVTCAAISASGDYILTGGVDKTLRLWETASGRCLRILRGHGDTIYAAALSADGRFALSGGADKTVRYWYAAGGRCLRTFDGHSHDVTAVGLPREGRLGISGGRDNGIIVWDLGERQQPYLAPYILCRTLDSESAISTSREFQRELGEARQAMQAGRFPQAAAALKKARAVSGYQRHAEAMQEWTKLYIRLPRGRISGVWESAAFHGHDDAVNCLRTTRDGRFLYSGGGDGVARVWTVQTGECLRTLRGHSGSVKSMAILPDGKFAITGSEDQRINLWDVANETTLLNAESIAGSVEGLDISPDGLFFLSGGWDMRLWETATLRALRTFDGHDSDVVDVRWTPDGKYAVSGSSDQTVKLWDVVGGRCLQTFKGHTSAVRALEVLMAGRMALSASGSMWGKPGRLRLWDLASGENTATMEGHTGPVTAVAVTHDSRVAVSGGMDATVRIWDLGTGACLRVLEGHGAPVTSVVIAPDARYAATGDADGLIKLWTLDWELRGPSHGGWDEEMRPFVVNFLASRQPVTGGLPEEFEPTPDEVEKAITRKGKPVWTAEDAHFLAYHLGCAGFGFVSPDALAAELEAESTRMGRWTLFGRGR